MKQPKIVTCKQCICGTSRHVVTGFGGCGSCGATISCADCQRCVNPVRRLTDKQARKRYKFPNANQVKVFQEAMNTLCAWWRESYRSQAIARADARKALDAIKKLLETEERRG